MCPAPMQPEWFSKPTVRSPERCHRATSFKGACGALPRKPWAGTALAGPCANTGLRALPLLIKEGCWGGGRSLWGSQSPSGNHPKGSGRSRVVLPSTGPHPPLASAELSCWKEWVSAPGPCRRQAEVSTFQGSTFPPPKAPCRQKAWAPSQGVLET